MVSIFLKKLHVFVALCVTSFIALSSLIAVTIISVSGVYIPYASSMVSSIGSPFWIAIMYPIGMISKFCLSNFPMYVFMLIYGEVVVALATWCQLLIDKDRQQGNMNFISSCHHFINALKATSMLFSFHMFMIIFLMFIGLIMSTYRTIAFFIGDYERNWLLLCSITSQTMFTYLAAAPILYLAFMEHEIHKRIEKLTSNLIDENSEDCRSIVEHLKNYKGFSALDFFYVNKQLLTSLFTNFVGYLIILLQFRVGEES